MKFDPEAVRSLLAGWPTVPGRPTQQSLWSLKLHLINGLRKIAHPVHKHEGYAPYLRTVEEQALVQNDPWNAPVDPGPCFRPSASATSDRAIETERNAWDFLKDMSDTFDAVKLVLTQIFEEAIDDAYHTGATGMGQRGFGNLTPDRILERLMELYGRPSLAELKKAMQRLHDPMD